MVSPSFCWSTCLRQIGQIDDAVQILRSATKKEPNNPIYELIAGGPPVQDRSRRRGDQAFRRHAQTPCRQRPDRDVDPPEPVGHLREPGRLSPRERPSSSCSSSVIPDDPGPNNDLGYLYAEQGKNLEKAESMIRKALQEEPESLRLSRQPGLGLVQARQGQGSSGAAQEGRRTDEIGSRAERDRPRRHDPRASGRRVLPAPAA